MRNQTERTYHEMVFDTYAERAAELVARVENGERGERLRLDVSRALEVMDRVSLSLPSRAVRVQAYRRTNSLRARMFLAVDFEQEQEPAAERVDYGHVAP